MADTSEGRSPIERYRPIYQAFLDAEVPLVALKAGEKRLISKLPYCRLRSLDEVEEVVEWHGRNLGAVTHSGRLPGINPLGFVNLDIDKPGDPLDLSPFTHMVRRQGETGRAQYWFRLREPLKPFKAFYGGNRGLGYDLATWNVVMPGSIKGESSLYELWVRKGGIWVLWDGEPFSIDMLPSLDLEGYLPEEPPAQAHKRVEPPVKVDPLIPAKRKSPAGPRMRPGRTWVAATGSEETLKKKAGGYLRFHALPCVPGMGAHSTLYAVVANLRLYFKRSLSQTIGMIRRHYDHRCLTPTGEPCLWSDDEIRHKYEQAGQEGAYPPLGVQDLKARRKVASQALQEEVRAFLAIHTAPGGSVSPSVLREAFIAHRGGEDVTPQALGRAISKCGYSATNPGGVRTYSGFRLLEADSGLTKVGGGNERGDNDGRKFTAA